MSSPSPAVSPELAQEIENAAIEMAWGAGVILSRSFRSQLTIEYKDKNNLDPVTSADKETQQYLADAITARFPSHGILGEETSGETEPPRSLRQVTQIGDGGGDPLEETDDPAPDILWVLDPLDGTTNFLNGLPIYASSIGVLHRGRPLAGALYLPWPNSDGGLVLHCRKGGGCFANDEPVEVFAPEPPRSLGQVAQLGDGGGGPWNKKPVGNRLVGLPGFFPVTTRVRQDWKGSLGEPRTTGSIAYELAMTAMGAMQYAVFGAPRMWDMLGGAIAVQEAKGTVMTRFRGEKAWHPLDSLVPAWDEKPPSIKELRRWVAPLVAGNPDLAPLIAHNLRPRFRPAAQAKRLAGKLRPRKRTA